MIQYDKDGVTLFYIDATGKKISHNFLEGTAYDDMLNVRGAQLQALRENTQAVANYNTVLGNAQMNIGRPGFVAPTKPLQKLVSDTGDVSFGPFDPPLPDLVIPVISATAPIAAGGLMGQMVRDGAAKPDTQAIMYNMILAMFRKMFPDA
jgi:hypothetical protein